MFHALFDLESEPDPHPNKKLLRPCVCAETVLLNVGEIIFGQILSIQYNTILLFTFIYTKKSCYIIN